MILISFIIITTTSTMIQALETSSYVNHDPLTFSSLY